MRALIDLLVGFFALLAATALSQFGVDLQPSQSSEREIHRVSDCNAAPSSTISGAERSTSRC